MPKYYDDEEDQNQQDWEPLKITKEPILTKDNKVITNDQFISMMRNKREELKLTVLQLNTKCKFPFKYTIRDIESGKTAPTLTEIKTIKSVLDI